MSAGSDAEQLPAYHYHRRTGLPEQFQRRTTPKDINLCLSLGWRIGPDLDFGDIRAVQLTPPYSACAIAFGQSLATAEPGSAQRLELLVSDIDAAR